MKNLFPILFFLLSINMVSSQNDSVKLLVKQTDSLNLEIWELTKFAKQNLESDIEIARFFYYWIGANIKYDYEFLKKMNVNFGPSFHNEFVNKQNPMNVYNNKKGVCAGYANLYKWFMEQYHIEVNNITGHIRDERNHYIELKKDDSFRHAWNAIKIDDKWLLVDTTWGTSYNPAQSEFYFNIKPELAINTHYPENDKWQLLEKPLTLEEFNNSKFVKPIWFFVGFSDVPKLKADKDYFYLVFTTNPEKKWLIELKISSDNHSFKKIEDTITFEQDGLTYIRFDKKDIPKKAFYKINLKQFDYPIYFDVINFKT